MLVNRRSALCESYHSFWQDFLNMWASLNILISDRRAIFQQHKRMRWELVLFPKSSVWWVLISRKILKFSCQAELPKQRKLNFTFSYILNQASEAQLEWKFWIGPSLHFTFSFSGDVVSTKKLVLVDIYVLLGFKFWLHFDILILDPGRREEKGKKRSSQAEGSMGCQCFHAAHRSQNRDGRNSFTWCPEMLKCLMLYSLSKSGQFLKIIKPC